ncbi:hypothetical protein J6590_099893 [Homalodisca vitripennis]|nr:hypothetical protein J6590_099893 [Homalodisca vitripennis]
MALIFSWRDGGYCDGSEKEDNELPALLDLNFLRGLVNGEIDCSGLLGAVTFTVPRGTRSKSVFCRRFQPTNYTQNGISRLLRTGEAASSSINFFRNSSFRTDAIGFLRLEVMRGA